MARTSPTQLSSLSLTGVLWVAARLLLPVGLAFLVTDAHAGVKFDKSCRKLLQGPERQIVKKAAHFLDDQFDLIIIGEAADELEDEIFPDFDPAFKAALRSEVDRLMRGKIALHCLASDEADECQNDSVRAPSLDRVALCPQSENWAWNRQDLEIEEMEVVIAGTLAHELAQNIRTPLVGPPGPADPSLPDHAATADHATTADKADVAAHAYTADHATTADHADHASKADHAVTADYAANAGHATSADSATHATRAGTADTLSSSLCAEGQILIKGPVNWECAGLPSTPIPLFAWGRVSSAAGRTSAYFFGESFCCPITPEQVDVEVPRPGILSGLRVSPRYDGDILFRLPSPGTEAVVTVLVNGADTALSVTHRFDIDQLDSVSNLATRVSVSAGDRIVLKFEEVGGVCVSRFNQLPGTCGNYRASFLLE